MGGGGDWGGYLWYINVCSRNADNKLQCIVFGCIPRV